MDVNSMIMEASASLSSKLEQHPKELPKCTIYRVHKHLRDVNPSAYEPEIMAIGPYHRDMDRLKMMEHHKLRSLQLLIQRKGCDITEYANVVGGLEPIARKCYADQDFNLTESEFVEMLVLDGCFIVELVRKFHCVQLREEDDPIFKMEWMLCSLQRDLMLFENQVPFLVLDKLFDLIKDPADDCSLVHLLSNFFSSLYPGKGCLEEPYEDGAMVITNYSCTRIHLILFYLCVNALSSLAADSISSNQSLSGDQTLVSAGESFVLGFFQPGTSPRYYIGIWYNKVPNKTVVWVANREIPVSDKNAAKLLISAGNLVLHNELGAEIWSTGLNSTSLSNSSLAAVLNDDGNLVLSDGSGFGSNPRSGQPLWQSIDNPVHTWLPGGKIAYDKRTGKKQLLTSWKNEEDPAKGLWSLELDPNGSQYIIKWNKSVQYWTSGAWNGHIFSLVPEMRLNYIYNFSYINNSDETYFTYSLYNPSLISRFIMDVSGQIKQQSWVNDDWNLFWSQPREQCQVHDYCGAFSSCQNALPFCRCLDGFRIKNESVWNLNDYSGGCVRERSLQCGSNGSSSDVKGDRFWTVSNVKLPVNDQTLLAGSNGECESSCLNNCSCTAYAYDEGNTGCKVWNGELVNLQQLSEGDGNGRTISIRLSASSEVFSASKNSKGSMIGVVLGCVAGAVVVVAVVMGLIWRRRWGVGSSKPVEGSLIAFVYKDLQNATKNFSDKLGGGGFGSVFKGTLPDSTLIAVKKLDSITQGEKQFRTEVSTIGTIQHVNLVRLRGFCSDGSKKLLVYDYMENGSLDSHLFHAKETKFLEWKTRYEIALGIARGLSYLHEKCRDCIIHCDIKPENILLDAEFCPKVADFGLAKLMGRDFSRVLTTMRGTRGYLAPEWISGVAITAKADVYSYGMMLFELVSGRRNSESSEDGTVKFFPSWAAKATVNGGDVLGLLDPVLDRNAHVEEVLKICKIACWCIQDDENIRPSMGQVVQILEGLMDVNVPPIPRSLQVFVESQEDIVFFTDSSSTEQSSQGKSNTSSASSNSKNSTLSTG